MRGAPLSRRCQPWARYSWQGYFKRSVAAGVGHNFSQGSSERPSFGQFQFGDSFASSATEGQYIRARMRNQFLSRGMHCCSHTRKLYPLDDMCSKYLSYEGRTRQNMFHGAKRRALSKGLPIDEDMILQLTSGPFPASFNSVPYSRFGPCPNGPNPMAITIDRISNSRGYVRGNVRFLPFWLNACLQHFSDDKALRIVERLLGIRPLLSTHPVQEEQLALAKNKISQLRSNGRSRGRQVGECMNFSSLVQHQMLVDTCRFSGIPLAYHGEKGQTSRVDLLSFDRVNPNDGYFLHNVQVMSVSVNSLKSYLSPNGLHDLLRAIKFLKSAEFIETHIPECACTR